MGEQLLYDTVTLYPYWLHPVPDIDSNIGNRTFKIVCLCCL
jgi:hypothetical protein